MSFRTHCYMYLKTVFETQRDDFLVGRSTGLPPAHTYLRNNVPLQSPSFETNSMLLIARLLSVFLGLYLEEHHATLALSVLILPAGKL